MRLGLCFCSAWCSQRQVWMATRKKWWRRWEEAYQPRVCSRMPVSNLTAEQRACLPGSPLGPAVTGSWYSSICVFGCPETWLCAVRHPLAKGWSSAGGGHHAVGQHSFIPQCTPGTAGQGRAGAHHQPSLAGPWAAPWQGEEQRGHISCCRSLQQALRHLSWANTILVQQSPPQCPHTVWGLPRSPGCLLLLLFPHHGYPDKMTSSFHYQSPTHRKSFSTSKYCWLVGQLLFLYICT